MRQICRNELNKYFGNFCLLTFYTNDPVFASPARS